MSSSRRKVKKWLLVLAGLVLLLAASLGWVLMPGGVSPEDQASAHALHGRIADLKAQLTAAPVVDSALRQEAEGIFNELMSAADAYRRAETDEAGLEILQIAVLRATKLADMQRGNPDLKLEGDMHFSERTADFVQRIVTEMIEQANTGQSAPLVIDTQDLIDAGAVVRETQPVGSLSLETAPQNLPGGPQTMIDPSMPPIVLNLGESGNELERMEPAARFLAVLNRPLWWNPVTEKLQEMLSPSSDVPAPVREKWAKALEETTFPIELIAGPETFEWRRVLPGYLERRLQTAQDNLVQTADWESMRDWMASRGSRHLPGQLIDGLFVKLRRKAEFRRTLDWIDTVIAAAPSVESFNDLASIKHAARADEMLVVADFASDTIRQRLIGAGYLLCTGRVKRDLAQQPYFEDPYTGRAIVLEKSWTAEPGGRGRMLLVSVGPDGAPDTHRQMVKDDVVVDVELDLRSAAWELVEP